DEAPRTFHRTETFRDETHDVIPPATSVLRDLNPMLRYANPYGRDIVAFFTDFGATLHHFEPDGEIYVRLKPYFGARSPRPMPVRLPEPIFMKTPYREPGSYDKPMKPFTGRFPRIYRDS